MIGNIPKISSPQSITPGAAAGSVRLRMHLINRSALIDLPDETHIDVGAIPDRQ
jgi:hypothetical protein